LPGLDRKGNLDFIARMLPSPSPSLDPAPGFLSLGMFDYAWEKLEVLPPEHRANTDVIGLRIEIYNGLEKGESARVLADSMAKRNPENLG
jgi:hypothetical protein